MLFNATPLIASMYRGAQVSAVDALHGSKD
jgi:hypothetical protein